MSKLASAVKKVGLNELMDAYLRAQTEQRGQSEMARLIGTKRQGVNMIVNRVKGRRFTWDHLERYAEKTGIRTSALLAEMSRLAWDKESELIEQSGAAPRLPIPRLDETGAGSQPELIAALEWMLKNYRERRE